MLPQHFVSAGNKYSTYTSPLPAPIFRKTFCVKSSLDEAELIIGATGFYDLYLNGEKITDGYLMPFISNPQEIIFYNKYSLTGKLKKGENTIGVMLGNGFANPIGGQVWGHGKEQCAPPAFALSFKCSDMSFDARDMLWNYSHILFDDYRCGTYCDMTKQLKSWCTPRYDDRGWHLPTLRDYAHSQKRLASCEPVKEIRQIKPAQYYAGVLRDYRMRDKFTDTLYNGDTIMQKTPLSGGYIYDFGENVAGVPMLKINGTRGQVIHMQFCELMFEGFADYINVDVYPDGCCQKDVYVCSGEGEEQYIPPFTYHGFRYCYVWGITEEQATADLLTCVVLHNQVELRSHFRCSDNISNLIFDACRRSDLSNLFYIITDCPQREKNGWTGDAAISAEHYMINYGVERCFSDWLCCLRAAQGKDGSMPLMVPSSSGGARCPVWDSVLFYLPYNVYKYKGNKEIIIDNADAMIKNLRFSLSLRDERGIVESGLGDWLPVDCEPGEYASPLGFCATIVLMDMCKKTQFMLDSIGMTNEAEFAEKEYLRLREDIRREYNDKGVIGCGKTVQYRKKEYRVCQTSQALGLYFNLFEESEKAKAIAILVDLIEQNDYSFDCGFLGMRVIFHVLSDYGYSDLAYKMITKPQYPSYANMIYRGETTVWERFASPGKRIGSHNHHFMADVSAWYLKCIAGINVNPDGDNPDKILINPHFISALQSAYASCKTPNGTLSIEWGRADDGICVKIKTEGDVIVEYGKELEKVKCITDC